MGGRSSLVCFGSLTNCSKSYSSFNTPILSRGFLKALSKISSSRGFGDALLLPMLLSSLEPEGMTAPINGSDADDDAAEPVEEQEEASKAATVVGSSVVVVGVVTEVEELSTLLSGVDDLLVLGEVGVGMFSPSVL